MFWAGILVESFMCAGSLLWQWQGENFAHRQHLKLCHFQPVQCASKTPISPKVFNRFSKSLPQLDDVEGGNLSGKFEVSRDFTFALARWKHCASTPFEILALSTCTLCQQKSYISKGIQPIFEIFASVRRSLEGAFGRNVSGAQVFYFAMARWKLCASTTFEILPLSTCTLSQQKSYISKGIQPIFEFFASARRCFGRAFWWKVSCAPVVHCCNGKAKTLRIDNIWNFATFNLYTVPAKTCISKGIQPIFEIFAWARRCWGWAFGWKVSAAQVFYFCNCNVKTLRIENIWNFATFNLYSVPAKILYLQRYSTDFRILCLSSTMLKVGIWVESFRCADILLLQWRGENFAHQQHLKFWHFQPVQSARKNPVSPKLFSRFSKSLPQREDLERRHLGGMFQVRRCFTFATASWKLCASTSFEISHFQPVHCHSKNPVSPKVFKRFSKTLLQLEDGEGGHLSGKFQVRRYFTSAMARRKLCASTTFEILPLSTCTVWQQKSYISKGFQAIFEIFASARWCWRWAFEWKISGEQVFYFCIGDVKTLRIENIWNFGTFNLYTVPTKILYLQRYWADFRNLCLSAKILRWGIWVECFSCAGILLLQRQGENFAHRHHLKFCHFQPVHCPSKNHISPKVFNRFSNSLPQLEDVWGGHFGGKFHVRR